MNGLPCRCGRNFSYDLTRGPIGSDYEPTIWNQRKCFCEDYEMDFSEFAIRKGLRTRYAKMIINSDYYGIVKLTNL